MVLIEIVITTKDNKKKVFPSPCGDYGSYPNATVDDGKPVNTSFRPLAGIMVLIYP